MMMITVQYNVIYKAIQYNNTLKYDTKYIALNGAISVAGRSAAERPSRYTALPAHELCEVLTEPIE